MKKKTVNKIIKYLVIVFIFIVLYFCEDIPIVNVTDNNKSNVKDVVNYNEDNLEIHFIDVGQADSILIKHLNNNILIDAGNNNDGEKLVQYFKSLNISKFNYVIGTHAHEDHIGGMDDILNNFSVDHYMMPDVVTTTRTFEDVIESMEKNNIELEVPQLDSKFNVGDLLFRVIHVGEESSDLNDTSVVLKMTYKNTSYLFTGDATKSVETAILDKDLKSDVLKVGHHGSQYSSSAQFLKKVSPKYSIIEVGRENIYDHPKDITLKKLEKIGSTILRTDIDHTIILYSDGENISFKKVETDTNGD